MTLPNYYPGYSGSAYPRAPLRWPSPEEPNAGVQWWWPEHGKVRARKLLSRAAMRPIYRFTSLKMGRSIHLESALEHQIAMLLDACPTVEAFAEQPVTMEFDSGQGVARHIPDLAVYSHGRPWFLELKYSKDVDSSCMQRTQRLISLLVPLGIGYRLVTEKNLPHQRRLSNAWALLQRGRPTVPQDLSLMNYQQVLSSPGISLGRLGWATPLIAASVARDLMQGRLHTDFGNALTPDSPVWTSQTEGNWLWA